MPTPQKTETIEQLTEVFKTANGVFLADFSGLTVEMMTELRKRCHAESVYFRVVKNTLAQRAANAAGLPDISPWLTGSTALAYTDDASRAVKLIQQFVKDVRETNGKPEIKTGLVEGQLLDEAQLDVLAKLPSSDVVRARFVGLLNAPAQKFVGLLSAGPASLARALDQRRHKLEEQSDSTEAGSNEAPAE